MSQGAHGVMIGRAAYNKYDPTILLFSFSDSHLLIYIRGPTKLCLLQPLVYSGLRW